MPLNTNIFVNIQNFKIKNFYNNYINKKNINKIKHTQI